MNARARRHWLTGLAGLIVIGVGIWSSGALEAPGPPPIQILSVARRADAPVPPALAGPPAENRVAFDVRVRRSDLAILAGRAADFSFEVFRCTHDLRTFYGSEIFLEGAPLRRHMGEGEMGGNARALLEREAAAVAKGPTATLRIVLPRVHVDNDWATCGRFSVLRSRTPRHLSASAILPAPGDADLAALGIVPEIVVRPAGREPIAFAEALVAEEAKRRGLPPRIWESIDGRIDSRESEPGHGRTIVIYFASEQPVERPGKVCRLNAVRGGLNRLKPIAYRRCAALLGIAPEAEPPGAVLITPVPAGHGSAPPPIPAPPPPPGEDG